MKINEFFRISRGIQGYRFQANAHARVYAHIDVRKFESQARSGVGEHVKKSRIKYIAAPIYYVNAIPHIGHLYTTVLGNATSNWYKLQGYKSIFSVGTDVHGLKVQQASIAAGLPPTQYVDQVSLKFKELFNRADITDYQFIQTNETRHVKTVQYFWKLLAGRGWIYKGWHEGWYCIGDECFVSESGTMILNGVRITKDSQKPVQWTREENYKFKLSAFFDDIKAWLVDNPNVITPPHQYRAALKLLEEGLEDISISRLVKTVGWGIPVPGDENHVVYVWMDALINYLTVTGYPWKAENASLNPCWPPACHMIGMDILKFHALYYPAFLMAAGLKMPTKIVSHGHWVVDGKKMSKSAGNGVDPNTLLDKWGVDVVRYFLLKDGVIANNPEFSLTTLESRYKHDLAGQIGNLAMRASSKKINPSGIVKRFIDETGTVIDDESKIILERLQGLRDIMDKYISQAMWPEALLALTDIVGLVNKQWSNLEPWNFSEKERQEKLESILYVAIEVLRVIGILLQAPMPRVASLLLDSIGVEKDKRGWEYALPGLDIQSKEIPGVRKVEPIRALFPKL